MTVLDPDKREYVVSHLKANVSYDFKMQCFNMAGPSEFSKMVKSSAPGECCVVLLCCCVVLLCCCVAAPPWDYLFFCSMLLNNNEVIYRNLNTKLLYTFPPSQ